MKIDDIAAWEAFESVGTHGNFSKAAKVLKLGLPQLSKRVAKLEDLLGVRLFHRSTRVVTLTDEGRAMLPKVSAVLEDLKSIETSFEDKQSLSGTIRITTVPFIAHRLLIPVIAKFKEQHPQVNFEVELSEGVVNLAESNIDLALRIHENPSDTNLVYRKLAPNRLILCASPGYLKKASSPIKKPADLRDHNLLMLNIHRNCRFLENSVRVVDLSKQKDVVCENGWFLTELALNNFGVLLRSQIDVREYLDQGRLVQVLKKYPLTEFGSIYAVIQSRKLLAARVRTFLDFVVQESSAWK